MAGILFSSALSESAARAADPSILVQPATQSIVAGTNASLSVTADGTAPLSYSWYFNDAAVAAGTNSILPLPNAQLYQSGQYFVIVTNNVGAVTSSVAAVTVSYAPDFLWARQAGGTNNYDEARAVGADSAGNIYVAGEFYGTSTFGTNQLIALGNSFYPDMFLAKYTRSGDLVWVKQAGGIYSDGASGLAVDAWGNIYVSGSFTANIFFGTITLTNPSTFNGDIFLAKFDPDGNVLWAIKAGGAQDNYADELALDPSGNPVITGYFYGTGIFGPWSFGSYGNADMFVAKYDTNGNFLWASSAGSTNYDRGEALAVDPAGYTYVGGEFRGPQLHFAQGQTLNGNTYFNEFLAKYDLYGNVIWTKVWSNTVNFAMAAPETNSVYTAGNGTGFSFSKLDTAGNELWTQIAPSDGASALNLTFDKRGNAYLAGSFWHYLNFPTTGLTNSGNANQGAIASYDSAGNFLWARQFGGPSNSTAYAVTPDTSGSAYAAGYFSDTATFGTNVLTSSGGQDIFVAKLGVRPPVLLSWPSDQTIFTGMSNTFTVDAVGENSLRYQWRFNGTDIGGATSSSYQVVAAQLTDAGPYSVLVSNSFGVAISPAAQLTVLTSAPAILVQPQSQVVTGGLTATLSVVATNSLPFFYQWYFSNAPIAGATAPTLVLSNLSAADRGDYNVLVTNYYGSILSDTATLTVRVPGTILVQPTNQVAPAGTNVLFVVGATGDDPLSFQWRFNGAPINGATNASLLLTNVQLALQGNYSVVVSNIYGKATSASAFLTVNAPPTISVQPVGQTLPAGTNAFFSLSVTGSPTLRFQWLFNNVAMSGRTQSSLTLTNIQATNSGNYSVLVTNNFGAATSSPALLTVTPAAARIIVQPKDLTTNAATPAVVAFTVTAAGTDPLSYQWQFNGTNLPGATRSSLSLSNLAFGNAGPYRVTVTNSLGSVTSSAAILTVEAGFLWARSFGGASDDRAVGVGADSLGNVYVAGNFSNLCSIGATSLTSYGDSDALLAKYDSSGSLVWVRQIGGAGADQATALTVNSAGEIYLGGFFTGAADFAGTNLISVASRDLFLAKYDSSGSLLWTRQAACTNTARIKALALDADGNCCLAGAFSSSLDFGVTNLTSRGLLDAFVVKYDNSGNLLWARGGGSSLNDEANGVAVDHSGNVWVTGYFSSSATFGTTNLFSHGGTDIFLVKYDPAGNVVFAKASGSNLSGEMGAAVAVDAADTVYVTGQFVGMVAFDPELVYGFGSQTNSFLARYTSQGELLWVRQSGNEGTVISTSLALDRAGNAYLSGSYAVISRFGNFTLSGTNDAFVAMCDATGNFRWLRSAGSPGFDSSQAIAVDALGGILIAGYFQSNLTCGSLSVTSAGSFDGFVSRMAAYSPTALPQVSSSPANQTIPPGATCTLMVGASPATTGFQWYFNGAPIPGATNSILALTNVQYANQGAYYVVLSNNAGSVQSSSATVTLDLPPEALWAVRIGGDADDRAQATAVDAAGNVYVAGFFTSGTLPFGTSNLVNSGVTDIFLAKYDSSGRRIWVKKAGGSLPDSAQALAVDPSGNVLMAGYFQSLTATFGNFTLVNSNNNTTEIFVAKYDTNGNPLWVKRAGGFYWDQATAIETDGDGNTYVTGSYFDSASFGSFGLSNPNVTNCFVAKYDLSGNVLWVKGSTGSGGCQGNGLALDAATNVYVTGFLAGTANFGTGIILNTNGINGTAFVAKYDRDGNIRWARKGVASGIGIGQAAAADNYHNVYATAYKRDYFTSFLLTKYDDAGNPQWFRTNAIYCCTGDATVANGIALDALGNPILTGYGNGTVQGLNTLPAPGYVLKYNSSGRGLWILRAGTSGNAVTTDAGGNIIVAGHFSTSASFAQTNLSSAGGNDAFLVKFGVRPPNVAISPTNQAGLVIAGSNTTLQASISGTGTIPFGYQWQLNGTNIAGATQSTLTISGFSLATAGRYTLIVQNPSGSVTGYVSALGLIPILGITPLQQGVTLTWPDTFSLQSATNVAGPYADWLSAHSPFINSFVVGEPRRFFRLRVGNPLVSVRPLPNHSFEIGLAGSPGRTYTLQASTNLTQWFDLQTDASPFSYQDLNSSLLPQRFYRARLVQ